MTTLPHVKATVYGLADGTRALVAAVEYTPPAPEPGALWRLAVTDPQGRREELIGDPGDLFRVDGLLGLVFGLDLVEADGSGEPLIGAIRALEARVERLEDETTRPDEATALWQAIRSLREGVAALDRAVRDSGDAHP